MLARASGVLSVGATLLLLLTPPAASAQAPEYPAEHTSERQIGVGGEVLGVVAPRDNLAFFNYTDYDRNALRTMRLRLFGEWRPTARLSLVGELRSENGQDLTTPALYARWRPFNSRDFVIQTGRIPPVTGAFPRRAYGRDNVVLGQPLAYQYLTSLRPDALPLTPDDVLRMRGRGWQPSYPVGAATAGPGVPLVAVSRWDTGISGIWHVGVLDFSAALTRGAPAIPVVQETNGGLMWSGRVASRVLGGATIGFSAARGQWLDTKVLSLVPGGSDRPSDQSVVGTDVEFGRGRWLVRGEVLRSAFEVPLAFDATTNLNLRAWSGFAEGRYRPHPRWQVGLRLERLAFSRLQGIAREGGPTPWDAGVDRVEAALGFRVTRHAEVRGAWQENWRDGGRVHKRGLPAFAVLYWF